MSQRELVITASTRWGPAVTAGRASLRALGGSRCRASVRSQISNVLLAVRANPEQRWLFRAHIPAGLQTRVTRLKVDGPERERFDVERAARAILVHPPIAEELGTRGNELRRGDVEARVIFRRSRRRRLDNVGSVMLNLTL